MSLLDSDSEIIEQSEKKKTSGRKAGTSGLNRFKGLNRFGGLTEKFREREGSDLTPAVVSPLPTTGEMEPLKDRAQAIKVAGKSRPSAFNSVIAAQSAKQNQTLPTQTTTSIALAVETSLAPIQIEPKIEMSTAQFDVSICTKQQATLAASTEQSSRPAQTEFKQSSEQIPRRVQADFKQIPNGVQSDFKQVSEQSSIGFQESLPKTALELNTGSLVGLQKRTMDLLFILSKQKASRVVGPITREQLGLQLNIHKENVKTVVFRLCKKHFLIRLGSKEGRGGYLKLEIPELVYHQLSMEESAGKLIQGRDVAQSQLSSERSSEQSSSGSSSSSSYIKELKTITKLPLDGEWAQVQIPEVVKDKLSVSVIFQCRDRGIMSPQDLQKSLDAFAFDVLENKILEKKKVMSPQGFFMGSIQHNGEYARPSNFESDEDKAERAMLERLEAQNSARELRKIRIFDLSFQEWMSNLSTEEIKSIVPEYGRHPGPIQDASLRSYFQNNVFSNNK